MSIEEARKALAKEGLTLVKLIREYDNASLYLCKRGNGSKIEAVIQDGAVIIAPEGANSNKYKHAFRVAFDFLDRWKPCPLTLEEWGAATREIATIAAQNGNEPFTNDLLIAVYSQLEREYKRKEAVTKCG